MKQEFIFVGCGIFIQITQQKGKKVVTSQPERMYVRPTAIPFLQDMERIL